MRRTFQDGMEITYGDLNKISSSIERGLYDEVLYKMLLEKQDAFFGTSLYVTYVNGTRVAVAAGYGFQTVSGATSPEPTKQLIKHAASENLDITTPDPTNPRIDIVCVKANRANSDTATRKFKDIDTSEISDESLVVETDWQCDLVITAGTPAGSPVAPSTPAGYVKIATLAIAASTGMASQASITDNREKLPVGGDITLDTSAFTQLTAGATTKLSQLFSDIDAAIGAGTQLKVAVANNQAATNVTGLSVNKASYQAMFFQYTIYRATNSSNVAEIGQGFCVYNATTDAWAISKIAAGDDDSGVTLSITSAGQVQYASDNMAGTGYTGYIRVSSIRKLNQ